MLIKTESLPVEFASLVLKNRDIFNYVLAGELRKEGPISFNNLRIHFPGKRDEINNLQNENFIDYSTSIGNKVVLKFPGFLFSNSPDAEALHENASKLYAVLRGAFIQSGGEAAMSIKELAQVAFNPVDLQECYQTIDRVLTYFDSAPFHIVTLNRSVMYDHPESNTKVVQRIGDSILDYEDYNGFVAASLQSLGQRFSSRHVVAIGQTINTPAVIRHAEAGLIFIACGQAEEREKTLGIKVKKYLSKRGFNAFFAEKENDLSSLTSHIFHNLHNCAGFIGILHKRSGNYETSVWINQEVAIAAFIHSQLRKVPSLILYEEGIAEEGLIKYTIANPLRFNSDGQALGHIYAWIVGKDFGSEPKSA